MTHGILNPASQERTGFFVGWKTGPCHHRNFLLKLVTGEKGLCGDFQCRNSSVFRIFPPFS